MAIVNRELDVSQQRDVEQVGLGPLATGVTRMCAVAAFPFLVETMKYAAMGVSGAPIVSMYKQRGLTTEAIGLSGIVLQAVGTSGSVGFSGLAAAGSTLLIFNTGDVLVAVSSGSNAAVADLVLQVAVKKLQDIVSYN